jgi:acetyl-CoA carboxylase carboxyl transferase subunit alpha
MARPEGYRKARRLIDLAGRFGLPIITFIDTAGAFPGIEAEANGQSEAIARAIEACVEAPVPIVATIIGEGGSGGAIAIGAADRVLMMEHAIYSVISPEGCASILWRDAAQAPAAAEALKLTAEDLARLRLIDAIIPEPLGGAHRTPTAAIEAVGQAIHEHLMALLPLNAATLRARRREKFLEMGREASGP